MLFQMHILNLEARKKKLSNWFVSLFLSGEI